jgi:hypothetical protein
VTAAFDARDFGAAVRASWALTSPGALLDDHEVEQLELVYGCRGDPVRAERITPGAKPRPGGLPPDACAVNVEVSRTCSVAYGAPDLTSGRRPELDRQFPGPTFVHAVIRNMGPVRRRARLHLVATRTLDICDGVPHAPSVRNQEQADAMGELPVPMLDRGQASEIWVPVPSYGGLTYAIVGEQLERLYELDALKEHLWWHVRRREDPSIGWRYTLRAVSAPGAPCGARGSASAEPGGARRSQFFTGLLRAPPPPPPVDAGVDTGDSAAATGPGGGAVTARLDSPGLAQAVADGRAENVNSLLRSGANPDGGGTENGTPLLLATYFGHLDVAKVLLRRGANVNARSSAVFGRTPLIQAAERGHTAMVALLLDAGARIDAADDDGGAALHRAAEEGRAEVVNLLLSRGAPVNAQDAQGATPLDLARATDRADVQRLMLERGAKDIAEVAPKSAEAKPVDPGDLDP